MTTDSAKSSGHAYFWSREEEKRLIDLWKDGVTDSKTLSQHIARKPEAIKKKLSRLGLVVAPIKIVKTTTGELDIPKELYTIEEALRLMAGALNTLQKPGLDKAEVARLKTIVTTSKAYQKLFADYVDYRGVEKKLLQLRKDYAELVKNRKKQPDSATYPQTP